MTDNLKNISMLLIFTFLLVSCEFNNTTEKKLHEIRTATKFDKAKQKNGDTKNIKREFTKDGIEYGIITLENSEKIKYWFESHHISKDKIGGALFEMPNGKLEFIEGYFCCEVQLPNKGEFLNSTQFLIEMKKVDGIDP